MTTHVGTDKPVLFDDRAVCVFIYTTVVARWRHSLVAFRPSGM